MKITPTKIMLANGLKDILLYRIHGVKNSNYENEELTVSAYENGRENGLTITCIYTVKGEKSRTIKSVTFSENRNSDNIVVYLDNYSSMNGLSEESYNTAKYFKFNDYDGVISYCINHLLGN